MSTPNQQPVSGAPSSGNSVSLLQGFIGSSAAAMASALKNMFDIINLQTKTKEQTIQQQQVAAEANSENTIKAGIKAKWGSFAQAFTQAGQSLFGIGMSARNAWTEYQGSKALSEINNRASTKNLAAFSKNPLEAPDTVLLNEAKTNPRAVLDNPDQTARVKNYATEGQREALQDAIKEKEEKLDPGGLFHTTDVEEINALKELTRPTRLTNSEFDQIRNGKDELTPEKIKEFQLRAAPDQQEQLLKQHDKLSRNEHPDQVNARKDTEKSVEKWNLWHRALNPAIDAAGSAMKGVEDAKSAAYNAAAQLAQAAQQGASGAMEAVSSAIHQVMSIIEGLMQTQGTIAQASR